MILTSTSSASDPAKKYWTVSNVYLSKKEGGGDMFAIIEKSHFSM